MSLESTYWSRLPALEAVYAEVHAAITSYAGTKGYLVSGRVKTFDSVQDKIDTGRFSCFNDIDDLVAFSVVIDVSTQEQEVRRFLERAFDLQSVRSGRTLQDERVFDFDSTRVYCTLGVNGARDPSVANTVFEVQIRTLLQHAWSKITHPFVYKPNRYDAQRSRLAAELLAQLESVDRTLERFERVAPTVKSVSRRDMVAASRITGLIDSLVEEGVIPAEMRPTNGRRLGENIFNALVKQQRGQIDDVLSCLGTFFRAQGQRFPRSVGIYQLAVVAINEAGWLDRGSERKPKHYYLTESVESLFPSCGNIEARVAI